MIPMMWRTLLNLLILSFIGKMRVFDLVWIMTAGGPLWSTETVSTYVYKRAFEWNTFDLGYPSTIAALWFVVVLAFALGLCVALPPARPARVLAVRLAGVARQAVLLTAVSLYTVLAGAPVLWVAVMSLRTTSEISADSLRLAVARPLGEVRVGVDHVPLRDVLLEQRGDRAWARWPA